MQDATLDDMTKYPPFDDDNSENCRVIVLAATYGEGEPTDNSIELVNEMKECLESEGESKRNNMGLLEYCVFGLGNRQYEHYNAMGKFFDSSLETFGGKRIMPLGLGDDDKDLEADFDAWKDLMWAKLREKYCANAELPTRSADDENKLPECEFEIEYFPSGHTTAIHSDIPLNQVHGSSKPYFTSVDCPVTACRELRSPEDGGSTVHVEIDVSNQLAYLTADNLGVLPLNDASVVQSVADTLGYDLDAVFSLKPAPGHEWHGAPFPMPITVRECLTRYLDLTSAPRRSDLKLLVQYARDIIDRKALQRLSSKEGKKEYKEKIMEGYVGMVDLLKLCPSLSIPLEHFVSVCHYLLPRFYTIASSSSEFPNHVHLAVSVTEDKRKDGSIFKGVCSSHLAGLKPSDKSSSTVRVFNRPSTFRLPKDSENPIIMIGPGTGVAPMRALLQERRYQRQVQNMSVGLNILYFGCKKREMDFIYREELESFEKEGVLNKFYLAFSREQNEKVYVQHMLSQNATETWDLIHNKNASIYVCGGVRMGHDVAETLKEIAVKEGALSLEEAKEYLASLANDGRFVQELWA
eukprot:scaffold11885_cov99-Cylindrotheca_fusiformis.AAC.1